MPIHLQLTVECDKCKIAFVSEDSTITPALYHARKQLGWAWRGLDDGGFWLCCPDCYETVKEERGTNQ